MEFIWELAKKVLRTFYWVLKIEKPLTVWCGDGAFSPSQQLVIEHINLNVHCHFGGEGNALGNLASTFVGVVNNSNLGIVALNTSDGLFEVFSAIKGLPHVIDEISEHVVSDIVTKGSPKCGIYLEFRISVIHQSFPKVSLLCVGCLHPRLGLQAGLDWAIIFSVSFLWNVIKCRS